MGSSYDDGMEGGADPCGTRGGGPDVKTGTYDGDGDGDGAQPGTVGSHGSSPDSGGAPGGGSDVSPPAGTSTASQPRPEEWIK